MNKIQELVKEGKLSKNFMEDKEFVNGAKKIFKSENIEMDDKKLAKVMDEIEIQLKKSNILDDKAIEEVSGGISGKGVARSVIKTVFTVVGGSVGGSLGIIKEGVTLGLIDAAGEYYEGKPIEIFGSVAEVLNVTGVFGYVGYRLGKWICKKAGLEEN